LDKLKELELYGKGLIEIDTPLLVGRYNDALHLIGLDPTKLTSFKIDGWGWSPEIAEEKSDNFYLSHGLANPYAIIISPEQENVAAFMPHHSFDNDMKNSVFKTYRRQIYDLTIQTAIILECDQDISSYRATQDLLSIEYFNLKFTTTDNLSEAKIAQMALERKFYEEDTVWEDKEMRDMLRLSYRKHGVLADKKFLMPEYKFLDIDSFYTRAFGGTFIIRNEKRIGQTLLIREKPNEKEVGGQASAHLEYNLKDSSLLTFLKKKDVVGVYPYFLFDQVEDMERIHFLILAEIIFEKEPDVDITKYSAGHIKRKVNDYGESGDLPDHYFELETLIAKTRNGQLIDKDSLSDKAYQLLMRPNPDLNKNEQWLIWRVLLKLNPSDLFRLYIYDKEEFFNLYQDWPEPKKIWAMDYIKPRYISSHLLNKTTI